MSALFHPFCRYGKHATSHMRETQIMKKAVFVIVIVLLTFSVLRGVYQVTQLTNLGNMTEEAAIQYSLAQTQMEELDARADNIQLMTVECAQSVEELKNEINGQVTVADELKRAITDKDLEISALREADSEFDELIAEVDSEFNELQEKIDELAQKVDDLTD